MLLPRIQGTIGMSIVIIALCLLAALLWMGVGGVIGCSVAGIIVGVVFAIVEKSPNRH